MKKQFFIFLVLLCQLLWGKESQLDSLSNYSLLQLEEKINVTKNSTPKLALNYAQAYLKKAQNIGSDKQLVKAYYYLIDLDSKIQKTLSKEMSIRFSDSIISLSRNKDYGFFSAYAYYIRGKEQYKSKNYTAALDDYILADKLSSKADTLELKYFIKQAMALLKHNIGDNAGALAELRIVLKYYEKKRKWEPYGVSAFSYSEVLRDDKQLDSAAFYIEKAKRNLGDSDFIILPYLAMGSGFLEYHKANYEQAIPLLREASEQMRKVKDEGYRAFCEYYLGQSKLHLKDTLAAIQHLEQVDSIYHQSKYLDQRLRTNYTVLIDYHEQKGNPKKELYYIKTLLQLDSLTQSYSGLLQSNIIKEYDVPKLLERKENLISSYQVRERKRNFYIIILSVFLGLFIVLFLLHRKKQVQKNLKYEQIISEFNQSKKTSLKKPAQTTANRSNKIPQKDIEHLQAAFLKYETELLYAKPSFNKDFIRKDTQINDHYITDYLRDYIGSSLTTYVNDKRIELSIKKMLEDSLYGKYTMQAMAEAVGYSNVNTFKRAFKKRTGMRPLEFLEKRKNNPDNS